MRVLRTPSCRWRPGEEFDQELRAEKDYPIVGQDTDGSVTPPDVGMEWVVPMLGHVTSSDHSVALGALLRAGADQERT